jgi:membrane protease YdiL (CAAX protease family)
MRPSAPPLATAAWPPARPGALAGALLGYAALVFALWSVYVAVLFALIHVPVWALAERAAPLDKLIPAAQIGALGLLCGWLLRRSGALWSCFLVHAANIAIALYFPPPPTETAGS